MPKIKLNLKETSYEVMIGTDNLAELGKIIDEHAWGKDIFIITDPLVSDLFGDEIKKGFKKRLVFIEVPRGERFKRLNIAAKLYDQLVKYDAHRDALIIALGGGVIGDMAGFIAATYMRGINYIQVPTTLLAQVDASVGGKTGVNHPSCKNLIGSFYQPKAVFIDVATLTTLPARELRTGLAEVVKYGIIEDADFFKFLEENAHHLNTKAFETEETKRGALKLWQIIVVESVKIKAKVVEKDEKENGLRMILNYGHTIGHAIESLTKYRAYNHGEAVAIGMLAAAMIANKVGLLEKKEIERIRNLLEKLGLPTSIEGLTKDKIIKAMGIDKKISEGKIKFVLPEKIGKVVIRNDIPNSVIKQVVGEMGAQ